jgi:hypothetical protein
MKFGDKVKFDSSKEIVSNLSKLHLDLKISASKVPVGMNDYPGFALRNLVAYSSFLVERLISYLEFPIELSAWTARNLFECYLIAAYIVPDPIKAKEFLTQKATDELEIYDGILSLKHSTNTKGVEKPIKDRMEHIKNTMKKHGLNQSKHWTVGMLAKQTGNKEEYEAFFKLYSKYVHPASWLINGEKSEFDNPTYRNIFLLQSQHYMGCLLKIASDYLIQKSSK